MRQRRKSRVLQVEGVESRLLMSGATAALPGAAALVQAEAAKPSRHVDLAGTMRGTADVVAGLPDTGQTYQFLASGKLTGFGSGLLSGRVRTVGFIASGQATGYLTLSSFRGSIVMKVEGPAQSGPSGLPTKLHFDVQSGTGAYRNLVDSGTITINGTPVVSHAKLPRVKVTLTFTSNPAKA